MVIEKNLMTAETKARLEKELERVIAEVAKAGQRMGDAFGPDCDWHDNAAADFAVEEYKRITAQESELRHKLHNVEIIKPRQETKDVGLGNTAVVKLGDFDEDETFTVLGPDDSSTGKSRGWISYESPIGQTLLGMKIGETKKFQIGDYIQTVTVKKILPGDFNNAGEN